MPERLEQKTNSHHERGHDALESHGQERREQLRDQLERRAESSRERTINEASAEREAKEVARSIEKERKTAEHKAAPSEKRREKLVRNKKTLDASFDREMNDIRKQMPTVSRTFSKIIHTKAVERVSDAAGKTVARPNAILAGSSFALVFTAAIYFWAKNAGYPLSGFETIAAFIVGWLCGIIFDFARIAINGKG